MPSVHVFASTGRFRSFEEMRAYIDKTYTQDGDGMPSAFMQEVGLTKYEPACIECVFSESGYPMPVGHLLAEASYSDQWLHALSETYVADAVICVFAPNQVRHPERASLEYLGGFPYCP